MLRTLLELPGRDGRLRLARLAGDAQCDPSCTTDCGVCKGAGPAGTPLFVGLSCGPVAQVQRLTRAQVLELVDVLDEWLFDTSAEGRRSTVQRLNSPPAV